MEPLDSVIAARALLENVTPLKQDCGRICGAACCQGEEDRITGMVLFPEEYQLYPTLPDGWEILPFKVGSRFCQMLVCDGTCDRNMRPLSCRMFPLLPTRKGAVMDRRGWAICPLLESGKKGLNPDFNWAVKQAGKLLYAQDEHAALLDALHDYNKQMTIF